MRPSCILLAVSVVSAGWLQAQPADSSIVVLWDSIYATDRAETVHDVVVLPNRNVLIVGSAMDAQNNRDGLFVLLDSAGRVLLRKHLGKNLREDVLWSGAEAENGTFYLVGHSYASPELGNQAWIVHLDDEGRELPMQENYFGGPGDDRFRKIAWTDRNTGLVAAQKANSPPGFVPLYQVQHDKLSEVSNQIGDGMAEDLVLMEKNPSGTGIWLAGNARKSDITRKGDVWVTLLDDRGVTLNSGKIVGKGKHIKSLQGGAGNFEGTLLLAGETSPSIGGDTDGWIAKYQPNETKQNTPRYFGDANNDLANCLLLTPHGEEWVVIYDRDLNSVAIQVYTGEKSKARHAYPISQKSRFDLVKILQEKTSTYLLVGTGFDTVANRQAIRVTSICDLHKSAWRGQPQVEIRDITFSDDDGNRSLGPEEYGTVRFKIANKGDAPLEEGTIRAELVGTMTGLSIKRPYQVLPFLPKGIEKTVAIAVLGERNLGKGTATLRITVEGRSIKPLTKTFDLACNLEPLQAGKAVTINYITPRPIAGGGGNTRTFETTEKVYPIELAINTTNSAAKRTDAKVYLNKTPLTDQKAPVNLTAPLPSSDNRRYTYYLSASVPLQDGRNVLYIEFEGETSDSIVVNFSPEKPNLHLLAIGIPYDDLKFTAKDARDLATAFAAQGERGLFNRVNVTVLATHDSTTNNSLAIAFQSLRDAGFNAQIKPNDYLVLFVSSHGVRGKDGRFYLKTSGCDPNYESTMFDYEYHIARYINPINCNHKLLFVDACHSGAAPGAGADGAAGASKGPSKADLAKALLQANNAAAGVATFLSCSADELSCEHSAWQNGAFTEALLEVFDEKNKTEADKGSWLKTDDATYTPEPDGIISVDELKAYLETRVPVLVREQMPNAVQNPVVKVDLLKLKLSLILLP